MEILLRNWSHSIRISGHLFCAWPVLGGSSKTRQLHARLSILTFPHLKMKHTSKQLNASHIIIIGFSHHHNVTTCAFVLSRDKHSSRFLEGIIICSRVPLLYSWNACFPIFLMPLRREFNFVRIQLLWEFYFLNRFCVSNKTNFLLGRAQRIGTIFTHGAGSRLLCAPATHLLHAQRARMSTAPTRRTSVAPAYLTYPALSDGRARATRYRVQTAPHIASQGAGAAS
jgi:hypothetical protein